MIRPLQDNVIIVIEPLPNMSAGGLHIVQSSGPKAKASRWARVIASGPGYYRQVQCRLGDRKYTEPGPFVPNETRPGDRVIVDELAGHDYALDLHIPRGNVGADFDELVGEKGRFRIVREDEIHLIERDEAQAAE